MRVKREIPGNLKIIFSKHKMGIFTANIKKCDNILQVHIVDYQQNKKNINITTLPKPPFITH